MRTFLALIAFLAITVSGMGSAPTPYPPPFVHMEFTTNLDAVTAFTKVVKAGANVSFVLTPTNLTIIAAAGSASNAVSSVYTNLTAVSVGVNSLNFTGVRATDNGGGSVTIIVPAQTNITHLQMTDFIASVGGLVGTSNYVVGPPASLVFSNGFSIVTNGNTYIVSATASGSTQTNIWHTNVLDFAVTVAAQLVLSNYMNSAQVGSQVGSSNYITAAQLAADLQSSNYLTSATIPTNISGIVTLASGTNRVLTSYASATNATLVTYHTQDGYHSGVVVNDKTIVEGVSFDIESDDPTDTNKVHWCILTGSTVTQNTNLPSGVSPSISVQPSSWTGPTNSSPVFTVTASGDATLYYQWRSNAVNLANGIDYSGVTTASMTASNIMLTNNYSVVITNSYGSITSSVATANPTNGVSGGGNGLTTGLVAVWEMEANDATDQPDATGNSHTMLVSGATQKRTPHIQGNFSGSGAGTAFWTNNESVFKTQSSFSVASWVNPASLGHDGETLFQRWGTGGNAWSCYLTGTGPCFPAFSVRNVGDGGSFSATSATNFTGAAWFLIVTTFNSTNAIGSISVNGGPFVNTATTDGINSSTESVQFGGTTAYTDETIFWSRVISISEVQEIWANGAGKFYPSW
jgi:hypothetical protein